MWDREMVINAEDMSHFGSKTAFYLRCMVS